MEPILYKLKYAVFARKNGLPRCFIGVTIGETNKALRIAGKGVLLKNKLGMCSVCGKDLSNPNSIILGIGPICAANMGIPILSGYTSKDIEQELHKVSFDKWIPKSVLETLDINEADSVPDFSDIQKKAKKEKKKKEKRMQVSKKGDTLEIIFDGLDRAEFHEVMFKVKALNGRRFKKEPEPHWICPDTEQNRIDLKRAGFTLSDTIEKREKVKIPELKIPAVLDKVLMPFQKDGVQFIHEKNGRALIGDEMGLGKTWQALAYLESINPAKTIIICPASLKLNWAKEINKLCTNYNLVLMSGKTKRKTELLVFNAKATKEIYIINWDIIGNKTRKRKDGKTVEIEKTGWVDFLIAENPDLVIADEIHFAKNPKTQRSMGLTKLGKRVDKFVGLSGTPVEKRPIEFFSTLNLVNSGLFSSWWSYAKKYCGLRTTRFGTDTRGATNIEELHQLVSTVMIRRKKEDVLKDLPPKRRIVIPLDITNRKTYEKAENNLIGYLRMTKGAKAAKSAEKAEHLVLMENLKQLTWDGKKKEVINWIKDYLETEDKLVVFTSHKTTLQSIVKAFPKTAVYVDGSVRSEDRQKAVESFQNNSNITLFVGNIKAAGEGLTLTAANATCFVEFGTSPGKHDQAEDRVHRIGQEADSVFAYYLVGKNTIDEHIMEALDEERKVVEGVLDGKVVTPKSLIDLMLEAS